jgi:hypothetical protein
MAKLMRLGIDISDTPIEALKNVRGFTFLPTGAESPALLSFTDLSVDVAKGVHLIYPRPPL